MELWCRHPEILLARPTDRCAPGEGAVLVDLSEAVDVAAVNVPVRAFTAQMAFESRWPGSHGHRWLLYHPDITLKFGKGDITWTFAGQTVHGGSYEANKWSHVALVFDGVDQTVTSYMNGFEVTTDPTTFKTFQLSNQHPLIIGNDHEDPYHTRAGIHGRIDNVRLMAHARSQRNVCKSAFGSNCGGAISYHPTSTQYELSMQIHECSAATMHTLACTSAIHRVCANLDAMKQRSADIDTDRLGALTPPGPPVSMGGVVVALQADTVDVACTPNDHLSVPVDWWTMEKHHPNCTHMTDHSSMSLYCNLASHGFCAEAASHLSSSLTTGVIFEADARAWVTCFEATKVVTAPAITGCTDLTSTACQEAVSALCLTHGSDGGILQAVGEMLEVHCFQAPSNLGLHRFII